MYDFYLPIIKFNEEESIATQLYEHLRKCIIQGFIHPNTLLTENNLSSSFNISRQPVRQALVNLVQDELIEIKPQKGSFVKKVAISDLKGCCFIRGSLEYNSLLMAEHLTLKEMKPILGRLSNSLKKQKKLLENYLAFPNQDMTSLRAYFFSADEKFHYLLCSFSGTSLTWKMVNQVSANLERVNYLAFDKVLSPKTVVEEHEAIYKHLEKKELKEAADLLKQHIYKIVKNAIALKEQDNFWFLDEKNA